jgi:hypothetical protein
MEKIILACLLAVAVTGCAGKRTLVKPVCADKAIYKKYDIAMPARPELVVKQLKSNSDIGEVARAYELDLLNMTEYSLQLENILTPIVTDTTIVQEIVITPQPTK